MKASPPHRARSEDAKAERRAHLLDAARGLVGDGEGIAALSLTALADAAGMAKSNVYRYFETREAVLVALLREEQAAWAAAVVAGLPRRRGGEDPVRRARRVARWVVEVAAARPRFCALTAALPATLEHNLSVAAIVAFKAETIAGLRALGAALAAAAPALDGERWAELLRDAGTLLVGLDGYARPSAHAQAALEDPALGFFRRDFAAELTRLVDALVLHATTPSKDW